MTEREPQLFTRRRYLTIKACQAMDALDGGRSVTNVLAASEAVASTALAHPEWDMTEERTWDEWEADE